MSMETCSGIQIPITATWRKGCSEQIYFEKGLSLLACKPLSFYVQHSSACQYSQSLFPWHRYLVAATPKHTHIHTHASTFHLSETTDTRGSPSVPPHKPTYPVLSQHRFCQLCLNWPIFIGPCFSTQQQPNLSPKRTESGLPLSFLAQTLKE